MSLFKNMLLGVSKWYDHMFSGQAGANYVGDSSFNEDWIIDSGDNDFMSDDSSGLNVFSTDIQIHEVDIAGSSMSDDEFSINPATGLPMIGGDGGVDVMGNPYGCDFSNHLTTDYSDTFNCGISDSFDDMSSFSCGIDDYSISDSFGHDDFGYSSGST